jgi:hypothetical protein
VSENQSGVKNVRREIAIVAGPKDWGDTRESWLARVPRKIKTVSFRTVKALWYGEITDPEHWAARDIRREAELIQARKRPRVWPLNSKNIAGGMRATDQDFLGRKLIALSASLASLALWIAPELKGGN